MGIIRRLREWREKVDGTLTGPAIETDSATVNGTTTTDALEADEFALGSDGPATSFADIGGSGLWSEDENSPFTASGAQSHTLTLGGSYDKLLLFPTKFDNTSGSSQNLSIKLNGFNEAYYYRKTDNTTVSNGSKFVVGEQISDSKGIVNPITVTGTPTTGGAFTITGPTGEGANIGLLNGSVGGALGDLTEITFEGGSGNTTVDVSVYGWSQ